MAELEDDALSASYLRGANLISRTTSATEYYTFNAHGDVVGLVSAAGTQTKTYDYDAFGNEKDRVGSDPNPFRYCSEYFDVESGCYYLRARYYDPSVGRFTQEDPAKDGLNWYSYTGGNPVLFIDPTGCQYVCADDFGSGGPAPEPAPVKQNPVKKTVEKTIEKATDVIEVVADSASKTIDAIGDAAHAVLDTVGIVNGVADSVIGAAYAATQFLPDVVSEGPIEALNNLNEAIQDNFGSTPANCSNLEEPQIGNKLDYIFGNATGSLHNIQRSTALLKQLEKIGIMDNPDSREYVYKKILEAYYYAQPIIQENGRILKEILIMGPNGALKMQTIWDGAKLVTVFLLG